MKYILNNATFTEKPIEIDNEKAVRVLESYRENGKLVLGDQVILVINNIVIKLVTIDIKEEKYILNQVK